MNVFSEDQKCLTYLSIIPTMKIVVVVG